MTLEDIEKGLIGFASAAIAALVGLVRKGDIDRIKAMEDQQHQLVAAAEKGRGEIRGELHELREKVDTNHEQLMNFLLSGRGK